VVVIRMARTQNNRACRGCRNHLHWRAGRDGGCNARWEEAHTRRASTRSQPPPHATRRVKAGLRLL